MWGLDAVRLFCTTLGGYKHILVAVDKFYKWIEVQPVAKVTSEEAAKFIRDITHVSAFPTGSSPTWAKLSLALPFGIFAKKTLSTSTTPLLPTLGAIVRSNEPTTWSFMLSKIVSTTTPLLMDKRCIHLRSASVRTYTFFTTGFPTFLSVREARGLQAFDLTFTL
jgi:hypothetical protein